MAKKFGATHTINSNSTNATEEIKNILIGQDLDVFVDNTGIPEIIETGYYLTSKVGRVILVGVPRQGKDIKIHSLPLHFGKTLIGSHGGDSKPERDIPRYLRLKENGICNFDGLVSRRFNLLEINEAIAVMQDSNNSGRVVIDLWQTR